MTGREHLLAEIEAMRLEAKERSRAGNSVEIACADLRIAADDSGYDPFDNPGHAKPLEVERRREVSRTLRRR